jgi:hypothetical protein
MGSPDNTTVAGAAGESTIAAAGTTDENIFERVGDEVVVLWHDAEGVFGTLESQFTKIEWPIVKNLIVTLGSQIGKAALNASIAAAPTLLSGGFGVAAAEVGAAIAATATVDAPLDIQQALQATQIAVQAVKSSQAVVTTGDSATVAAITAAVPEGATTTDADTTTGASAS